MCGMLGMAYCNMFCTLYYFSASLSASTSSFSRIKNVWQVSVRARASFNAIHTSPQRVWVCVCVRDRASVGIRCIPRMFHTNGVNVFVFNKKVDCTWQKTVSVQWTCAQTAVKTKWWAAVLNVRWKFEAIAQYDAKSSALLYSMIWGNNKKTSELYLVKFSFIQIKLFLFR